MLTKESGKQPGKTMAFWIKRNNDFLTLWQVTNPTDVPFLARLKQSNVTIVKVSVMFKQIVQLCGSAELPLEGVVILVAIPVI